MTEDELIAIFCEAEFSATDFIFGEDCIELIRPYLPNELQQVPNKIIWLLVKRLLQHATVKVCYRSRPSIDGRVD